MAGAQGCLDRHLYDLLASSPVLQTSTLPPAMDRRISSSVSVKLLLLATLLLVPYPATESQWVPVNPPPLCASQFALVNHACFKLPYTPVPPPSPPSPTPSPPSPPSHSPTRNRHHSRHGHRHRRHAHRETAVEEECCRWLKEVDSVCVCELLVHLPPFLTKPVHNYTVQVDDTCAVTFACGSNWMP